MSQNPQAQEILEYFFTRKIQEWIRNHADIWTSRRLYDEWLSMDVDIRHEKRQTQERLHLHNSKVLLTNQLPDGEAFAKENTLVHFYVQEKKLLGEFSCSADLGSLIWDSEQAGYDYQLAVTRSKFDAILNCADPRKLQYNRNELEYGKFATKNLLWSHISCIEKLKSLWFNDENAICVSHFFGCAAIIEICLMMKSWIKSPIHSICALVGDFVVGLRRPSEREGQMIVQLTEKRYLGNLGEIAEDLQKHLKAFFSHGSEHRALITSVVVDNIHFRVKVEFCEKEFSVYKMHLLFTYASVFYELKSSSKAKLLEDPLIAAVTRNAVHLVRETFVVEQLGPRPDLRFGLLLVQDLWRQSTELQRVFSCWDLVVILWAMDTREPLMDPSMALQRLFSAISTKLCGARFESSNQPSRSYSVLFRLPNERTNDLGEFIDLSCIDVQQLDPNVELCWESFKRGRFVPIDTTISEKLYLCELQNYADNALDRICSNRIHELLIVPKTSRMTYLLEEGAQFQEFEFVGISGVPTLRDESIPELKFNAGKIFPEDARKSVRFPTHNSLSLYQYDPVSPDSSTMNETSPVSSVSPTTDEIKENRILKMPLNWKAVDRLSFSVKRESPIKPASSVTMKTSERTDESRKISLPETDPRLLSTKNERLQTSKFFRSRPHTASASRSRQLSPKSGFNPSFSRENNCDDPNCASAIKSEMNHREYHIPPSLSLYGVRERSQYIRKRKYSESSDVGNMEFWKGTSTNSESDDNHASVSNPRDVHTQISETTKRPIEFKLLRNVRPKTSYGSRPPEAFPETGASSARKSANNNRIRFVFDYPLKKSIVPEKSKVNNVGEHQKTTDDYSRLKGTTLPSEVKFLKYSRPKTSAGYRPLKAVPNSHGSSVHQTDSDDRGSGSSSIVTAPSTKKSSIPSQGTVNRAEEERRRNMAGSDPRNDTIFRNTERPRDLRLSRNARPRTANRYRHEEAVCRRGDDRDRSSSSLSAHHTKSSLATERNPGKDEGENVHRWELKKSRSLWMTKESGALSHFQIKGFFIQFGFVACVKQVHSCPSFVRQAMCQHAAVEFGDMISLERAFAAGDRLEKTMSIRIYPYSASCPVCQVK